MQTASRTRLLTTVLAVMGLLVLPGVAAFAQYAPSGDDFVTCTPDPASPGDTVECAAGIFDPNTEVDVFVEGSVLLDTTVTANAEGEVSFAFDIPEDHPLGSYEITLTGTKNGEEFVLQETNPIAAEPASGAASDRLSDTGSNIVPVVVIALVGLALGGGALVATRNRGDKVGA